MVLLLFIKGLVYSARCITDTKEVIRFYQTLHSIKFNNEVYIMGVVESRPCRKILNQLNAYPYTSPELIDTISIANIDVTVLTVTVGVGLNAIEIVVGAGQACNNASFKPFSVINASGSGNFSIALMW